ncbi:unnamed protein product, partial [Amoebophrya sp. A25]
NTSTNAHRLQTLSNDHHTPSNARRKSLEQIEEGSVSGHGASNKQSTRSLLADSLLREQERQEAIIESHRQRQEEEEHKRHSTAGTGRFEDRDESQRWHDEDSVAVDKNDGVALDGRGNADDSLDQVERQTASRPSSREREGQTLLGARRASFCSDQEKARILEDE